MSLVTRYAVECDSCFEVSPPMGDPMELPPEAWETTNDGEHFCPNCAEPVPSDARGDR